MTARWARVRAALRMVARRPARSALAAVGVAVTLASLLIAVAVAERGRGDALDEIRRMGATVLTVSAQESRNRGTRARTGNVVRTLTLRDARDVERLVPGVTLVAGEYRSFVPVKVGALARQASVAGIEPSYGELREAPLAAGRFFGPEDDAAGERVAVLGARIARDLYGGRAVVGEQIRVRAMPFTVIGVLPERGTGLDAFDEDEVVFIPLKTARRRLFQVEHLQRLFVRTINAADLPEVESAIVTILRGRHRANAIEPADFRVQDQRRLVTLRQTTVERLGAFQVTVSAALLAAGASGVFALQLLAVRERRSEIGTRRAIGATRGMVFVQFVVEAGAVTIAGATMGTMLGFTGGAIARASVSTALALVAFAATCAAGLIAASEPARRAAALPPVVALRAE